MSSYINPKTHKMSAYLLQTICIRRLIRKPCIHRRLCLMMIYKIKSWEIFENKGLLLLSNVSKVTRSHGRRRACVSGYLSKELDCLIRCAPRAAIAPLSGWCHKHADYNEINELTIYNYHRSSDVDVMIIDAGYRRPTNVFFLKKDDTVYRQITAYFATAFIDCRRAKHAV